MIEKNELACLDPYDPWTTSAGVWIKKQFYEGKLSGKLLAIVVAVIDWIFPKLSRKVMGSQRIYYPITVAQWIMSQPQIDDPKDTYELLMSTASKDEKYKDIAWGLGFPWMSKNGLYNRNIPFVTHTPYAMEALLRLAKHKEVEQSACQTFKNTKQFLDSLLVMAETDEELALSYAPITEPRIVVNANSYACYAYALHGIQEPKDSAALEKAVKIARWVVSQQNPDGSWYYYADNEPGNFIDCFHTCFVLKNLAKASKLVPEIANISNNAYNKGFAYLENHFFDKKAGLVKRFVERDIKDPYLWDLYDQAEYLGVLIDAGRISEAEKFKAHVDRVFTKNGRWYCRKDVFGRLWGEGFYRWGIMPYFYQCARLQGLAKENNQ